MEGYLDDCVVLVSKNSFKFYRMINHLLNILYAFYLCIKSLEILWWARHWCDDLVLKNGRSFLQMLCEWWLWSQTMLTAQKRVHWYKLISFIQNFIWFFGRQQNVKANCYCVSGEAHVMWIMYKVTHRNAQIFIPHAKRVH